MSLINWDTPKKLRSTKEHNGIYVSDSGVPGTYVPNMSKEDQLKWKGKFINKGKDTARIELRKTFTHNNSYAQVLIIIEKDGTISMSTNGKIIMTASQWVEMNNVITEAMVGE